VKVGLRFYYSPRVTTDAQQKVKFLELARLVPEKLLNFKENTNEAD